MPDGTYDFAGDVVRIVRGPSSPPAPSYIAASSAGGEVRVEWGAARRNLEQAARRLEELRATDAPVEVLRVELAAVTGGNADALKPHTAVLVVLYVDILLDVIRFVLSMVSPLDVGQLTIDEAELERITEEAVRRVQEADEDEP